MPPPLSRLDLAELRRLLQLAASIGVAEPPSAEDFAREAELRAESDRLAAKEEKAARRLASLRSELDRVSCELHALLQQQAQNLHGLQPRRDNEAARRALHRMAEHIKAGLPEYVAQGYGKDPQWIQQALEMFLEMGFPALFKPADNVVSLFEPKKENDDEIQ